MIRSHGADEPIAEILALILRHVDADAVLPTNIGWPRQAAKKRLGDTTLASIRVALSCCCLLSISVHSSPRTVAMRRYTLLQAVLLGRSLAPAAVVPSPRFE